MSCKAFNGRIVLGYLADVSRLASTCTLARRHFGHWLEAQVRTNRSTWPNDPKIPLQAAGMKLRGKFMLLREVFVLTNAVKS